MIEHYCKQWLRISVTTELNHMIIRIARQNSKQWKPNKTINPRVDSLSGCQVGPSPLWYSHLGLFCKRKCWITSITIQTCEWHVLLSVVNKSIVSYCLLVTYNSFLTFTFPVTRCMVSSLSFLWCFKSKRLEESSGMFLLYNSFFFHHYTGSGFMFTACCLVYSSQVSFNSGWLPL